MKPSSSAVGPGIMKKPTPGWKPHREFLFGIGQPWEPDSWDYEDLGEDELLLAASQQYQSADPSKHKVDKAPNGWGSTLQLDQILRDGNLIAMQAGLKWRHQL